ncbi:hypothetical protein [Leucobacter sp. NPDC077196]|uniref:hypothetical protein n=1 Tax=Leucobacter sp. NPDC077196 TaxID=3154959 RepID=UPI003437A852
MSEIVPADEIENIVGASRHPVEHVGRADSETGTVYILHSQECIDSAPDLLECEFSVALDRGIRDFYPWMLWEGAEDAPVELRISRGYLVPRIIYTNNTAALAAEREVSDE